MTEKNTNTQRIEQLGVNPSVSDGDLGNEGCNLPVRGGGGDSPAPIDREPAPTPAPPPKDD